MQIVDYLLQLLKSKILIQLNPVCSRWYLHSLYYSSYIKADSAFIEILSPAFIASLLFAPGPSHSSWEESKIFFCIFLQRIGKAGSLFVEVQHHQHLLSIVLPRIPDDLIF